MHLDVHAAPWQEGDEVLLTKLHTCALDGQERSDHPSKDPTLRVAPINLFNTMNKIIFFYFLSYQKNTIAKSKTSKLKRAENWFSFSLLLGQPNLGVRTRYKIIFCAFDCIHSY